MKKTLITFLVLWMIAMWCQAQTNGEIKLETFRAYFESLRSNPRLSWNFTTDTVRLWFDEKIGPPVIKVKDSSSSDKWKAWDVEMNTELSLDTIWFDPNKHAVVGYFFENNDFYKLIGKPPTKTFRTYWLVENKISEVLIYWIPEENTLSDEYLKPIVEWARNHEPGKIQQLYPNGEVVPSKENAKAWKELIKTYISNNGKQ